MEQKSEEQKLLDDVLFELGLAEKLVRTLLLQKIKKNFVIDKNARID